MKKIVVVYMLFSLFSCTQKYSLSGEKTKRYTNISSASKSKNKVEVLDLGYKNLKIVPNEIFQFRDLQVLILSRNTLRIVPKDVFNLDQLKVLNIGFNHLDSISPDIGRLQKLEELYIMGNNIKSLPESLWEIESLRKVVLYGNDLDSEKLEAIDKRLPNCRIHFY